MGEQVDVNKLTPAELEETFIQGDGRYNLDYLGDLYTFFLSKALIIEKEKINDFDFTEKELSEIRGPQKASKATATRILLNKGCSLEGYEINIEWGIVDVLGKNKEGLIVVECGPCRLNKSIDYFRMEEVKALWLVHIFYNEKTLYIIRKGPNWQEEIKKYNNKFLEQLRKIKSPLDDL